MDALAGLDRGAGCVATSGGDLGWAFGRHSPRAAGMTQTRGMKTATSSNRRHSGLAKLSAPLRGLADFLRVDEELLEAAAAGSTGEAAAAPSRAEMVRWVKALPQRPCGRSTSCGSLREEGDLLAELAKRFRRRQPPRLRASLDLPLAKGDGGVTQLLAARAELAKEKSRTAAERAAKARTEHLDQLAAPYCRTGLARSRPS